MCDIIDNEKARGSGMALRQDLNQQRGGGLMNRLEQDRAAALEASLVSQLRAKRETALYDATPDLLAALQRIVAVLDKQVASPHLAERASPLAQAKAAIAKATGETA